jgi:hypothetical protein
VSAASIALRRLAVRRRRRPPKRLLLRILYMLLPLAWLGSLTLRALVGQGEIILGGIIAALNAGIYLAHRHFYERERRAYETDRKLAEPSRGEWMYLAFAWSIWLVFLLTWALGG